MDSKKKRKYRASREKPRALGVILFLAAVLLFAGIVYYVTLPPLNIHSGSTGFKKRTDFYQVDPILMAPYLKKHKFYATKIVFLHESFPFTRNAAIMAYNFPNVYLDLSQTLPWQSLLFPRCLEDALSITPHDKIVLGTGQHWYAEMAWIASYIAKRSMERVMTTFVEDGLLSEAQAKRSARLVLGENGMKLYAK